MTIKVFLQYLFVNSNYELLVNLSNIQEREKIDFFFLQ